MEQSKINACIMALYLFQFGFLQPIASAVSSQWPVAAFTLMLVLVVLVKKQFTVRTYLLAIFAVTSIYFLASAILLPSNIMIVLSIYAEFILKCFSAILIASIPVKGKELFDAFLKLALINFFAIAYFPFTHFLTSGNYMRFGYAMVPSVLMFFYAIFYDRERTPLWIMLTIISTALTIVYGSRGPLLVFAIFTMLLFFFIKKINQRVKAAAVVLAGLVSLIIVRFNIISKILDYVYLDLGIKTYALEKFRLQVSEGLVASSSGRGRIYARFFELIQQNRWFGNGIGITHAEWNLTPHNLFIQVIIEAGIIGLVIWLILWLFLGKRYVAMNQEDNIKYFLITTLVISLALGRLLISSDMWLRPEYWFAISMLLNDKYKRFQGAES